MNFWHPIGLAISFFVIYGSLKDDRSLRTDPDGFILRTLRGETLGYYLTLHSAIGRITRYAAVELAAIQDATERRQRLEALVLAMPHKDRILRMTLWEIRFRLVVFVAIAVVLSYDLIW
ncbi:MAG: hypothetical protein KF893_17215 [Caldilineaceae bacterium]|nr:hypothetical protein [Caldilineaceae bacterium]